MSWYDYGFWAYYLRKISNWIGEFKGECSSNDGFLRHEFLDLGFAAVVTCFRRFLVKLKQESAIFIKNWAVTKILSKIFYCVAAVCMKRARQLSPISSTLPLLAALHNRLPLVATEFPSRRLFLGWLAVSSLVLADLLLPSVSSLRLLR